MNVYFTTGLEGLRHTVVFKQFTNWTSVRVSCPSRWPTDLRLHWPSCICIVFCFTLRVSSDEGLLVTGDKNQFRIVKKYIGNLTALGTPSRPYSIRTPSSYDQVVQPTIQLKLGGYIQSLLNCASNWLSVTKWFFYVW